MVNLKHSKEFPWWNLYRSQTLWKWCINKSILNTRNYLVLTKQTKLTTNGLDHLNQDANDVTDSLILLYSIRLVGINNEPSITITLSSVSFIMVTRLQHSTTVSICNFQTKFFSVYRQFDSIVFSAITFSLLRPDINIIWFSLQQSEP